MHSSNNGQDNLEVNVMTRMKSGLITFCLISLFLYLFQSQAGWTANQEQEELEEKLKELEGRLNMLEPKDPRNLYPADFHPPFPSKTYSIAEVIQTGRRVPFQVGVDRPEWVRPVYIENWHSTYWGGRFSYVPYNLYLSGRRMFIGFQSAGIWFGLTESLGIAEELREVENPEAFREERVNEKMVLVIMQARVKEIYKKENQLVLVSEPQRTGLQVITLKHKETLPADPDGYTLFQLVTPEGYEIDFTLFN